MIRCILGVINNMKQSLFIIGFLLLLNLGLTQSKFEKTVGQNIYFTNGEVIKTNISDLKFFCQIPETLLVSYLIIGGKPSSSAEMNLSIFIQKPKNHSIKITDTCRRYSYPGKEYHWKDNSLIYESRAFYGEVILNRQGII